VISGARVAHCEEICGRRAEEGLIVLPTKARRGSSRRRFNILWLRSPEAISARALQRARASSEPYSGMSAVTAGLAGRPVVLLGGWAFLTKLLPDQVAVSVVLLRSGQQDGLRLYGRRRCTGPYYYVYCRRQR
jgi:hypothetical protein